MDVLLPLPKFNASPLFLKNLVKPSSFGHPLEILKICKFGKMTSWDSNSTKRYNLFNISRHWVKEGMMIVESLWRSAKWFKSFCEEINLFKYIQGMALEYYGQTCMSWHTWDNRSKNLGSMFVWTDWLNNHPLWENRSRDVLKFFWMFQGF